MRTFASRKVFSPPYTPPEKMTVLFCVRGRSRFETVCNMLSKPLHGQCAAGEAVEGIERRQIRLERAH